MKNDPRWRFGLPPDGNANYAWIQHMISHLKPTGRIGLVLANGALTSATGGEDKIREAIVKEDLVERTKCKESRALAAMRDALLPKLMSGELAVEKVEAGAKFEEEDGKIRVGTTRA